MSFDRLLCIVLLTFNFITAYSQEPPMPQVSSGTARKPAPAENAPAPPPVPQKIDLAVPKGTPLQVAPVHHEGDRDHDNLSGSDPTSRGAGGLGGFKLVGMALGIAVPSRAFGYSMGAYGAGMSVYSHFIARGNEVVFPKNTAMEIGIGTRGSGTSAPPASPMQ